jgi:two-component system OmpR family response regulator
MDSPRVVVVIEDDQDIRDLIKAVLNQSGFEVHASSTGAAGVEAVREHRPTLVTLDLGLPDIDGFEVARRIRLFSDCYIIMLTARAEELDTLLGLEAGADDYLTKPFRPRELRARVGAMLRRPRLGGGVGSDSMAGESDPGTPLTLAETAADGETHGVPASDLAQRAAAVQCHELDHRGLTLNIATRTADVEGKELELTRTEFDLLQVMLESGSLVRTKAELVRRLRGEEYDVGGYINDSDERTVEVHMANLRRKLGDDPRQPRWIKTVRGVGYQMSV